MCVWFIRFKIGDSRTDETSEHFDVVETRYLFYLKHLKFWDSTMVGRPSETGSLTHGYDNLL